ncbi:helix-turn-helix transcriptional regulator [Pedobacter sp.]|jgi:plasmid maintenance system antidote protein VapI|uniref:helix-turn-helix domain-containing protein n=1 Tax=Pedobacter sp. TaxID=1411316 RepID=UPI002BB48071|nr:helix-turn-helix transcriptional regulator [Pedobacter sp.]HWW42132.1 helix-turn-helix transcriptional regulator [Pedobacter sp.]
MNKTIGEAIDYLIQQNGQYRKDIAEVLKISGSTLTDIIRNEKELSFLMGMRLLEHFELSVDEFLSLLSKEEIDRKALSSIKFFEKKKRKEERLEETNVL